jgi:hypothetical protein
MKLKTNYIDETFSKHRLNLQIKKLNSQQVKAESSYRPHKL